MIKIKNKEIPQKLLEIAALLGNEQHLQESLILAHVAGYLDAMFIQFNLGENEQEIMGDM